MKVIIYITPLTGVMNFLGVLSLMRFKILMYSDLKEADKTSELPAWPQN